MAETPKEIPPDEAPLRAAMGEVQEDVAHNTEGDEESTANCIRTELGEMNEIESRCPRCGGNGTTRLMITNIPHFKEVIVSSFECPHCGERNNEVTFGGEFGPKSVRYELEVKSKKDLDRQVVKSEYATIRIPELDLEIPRESQRGVLNTVEGFLEQTESGLQLQQPLRRIQHPELYEKLETFCEKVRQYRTGDVPFTFIIDDPAGNSYVEAYYDYYHPTIDPQLTRYEKERTNIDRQLLGLTIEYNTQRTDAEQREVQEGQFDDVVRMETECSACKKPGFINIQQVNIPYFKETVIMAFRCDFCGYKSNEVKSGGAVAEKGLKITLEVKSESDLKRDVLKSDSTTLLIPEVALELAPGTLGGFFSTVEGTLMMVRDQLKSLPQAQFAKGDAAATDPEAKTLTTFVKELEHLLELKRPFTFILDDPLANVYIQNPREHLPPPENEDPQLTKTYYTRTFEQDEELGFHQMNVN
ncbi:zinc-finger protein ZPR1, putative [Trypanosoma equiperdum]|uniref:Zinc-finger protein ZPR1, putative n=2 Tax=Trypanozoon TaxID=39700 RepID=Q57ZU8_TRYB2|nr:zinc-finger protein ZPR1, putative [Trypanosoma brucei brucei TREU927]AAX79376.1 zinc-finger protein ZPR1, putative [Trypanosoma brucei]AAZ11385.1 zinc-finger protein ZPR1, putative [Trypanosoma brucei brucei TREU927]SCU64731.1 zinc-finger protein ZPR1, putative [Trypanosoma equiperdum]